MTARLLRRMLPALLVAVALLAAACTVGPSQRPPVAVRGEGIAEAPTPTPTPAPPDPGPAPLPELDPQRPVIDFVDCTAETLAVAPVPVPPDRTLRVDCGELTVPGDPGRPQLGRSRVGVLRVGLADAPADRPPLLVVGDSADQPSAGHSVEIAAQVPLAILDRFTLIGLDRRGFGADALVCAPAAARAALVGAHSTDPVTLAVLLEYARVVVQECHVLLSGGATGFRSASTAFDVLELRNALGVTRLSAVGVGDGATALARWARLAPETVGRLVLDAPPDPVLDEPGRSASRAAAAESAFDAFALACTIRADCPLSPDPRAAVTDLLARLGAKPLQSPDGRPLTAGGSATALLHGLGEPRTWPALATSLAAARAGNPVGLLEVLEPIAGLGGRFDAMLATSCNDATRRLSPGEISELAAGWRTEYPMFGTTFALRLIACAPWPAVPDADLPAAAPGLPPVLVLGTAHDPRGPMEGSRRAAEALSSAGFLAWQGAGTGAYPRTPCVNDAVGRLLVDGVAPSGDLERSPLCPP